VTVEWWTSEDVANHLRCEVGYFNDCVKPLEDFPRPMVHPYLRRDGTLGKARPLWRPADVRAWVESHMQAAE
jgi:hypothetical protein